VLLEEHNINSIERALERPGGEQLASKSKVAPLQKGDHDQNNNNVKRVRVGSTKKWRPQLAPKGLSYSKVLGDNKKANNNNRKFFPNEVLGYITPWNSAGFDVALQFQSKFTFLSPVWFQIKRLLVSMPRVFPLLINPTQPNPGNHLPRDISR